MGERPSYTRKLLFDFHDRPSPPSRQPRNPPSSSPPDSPDAWYHRLESVKDRLSHNHSTSDQLTPPAIGPFAKAREDVAEEQRRQRKAPINIARYNIISEAVVTRKEAHRNNQIPFVAKLEPETAPLQPSRVPDIPAPQHQNASVEIYGQGFIDGHRRLENRTPQSHRPDVERMHQEPHSFTGTFIGSMGVYATLDKMAAIRAQTIRHMHCKMRENAKHVVVKNVEADQRTKDVVKTADGKAIKIHIRREGAQEAVDAHDFEIVSAREGSDDGVELETEKSHGNEFDDEGWCVVTA